MKNDITGTLYRIKEKIKTVESGDESEYLLKEVLDDFFDLIEYVKLFLISERDSYYGYFLMNMQFRADFHIDTIAGIKLNEFPPVFESNPLLLCRFQLKEILYIVCHEIDHVVFNHPSEMLKSNPKKDPLLFYEFNLAADAAVNDRINHEIVAEKHKFLSAPDGVITSDVLKDKFHLSNIRTMENYAYYLGLIQDKKPKVGTLDDNLLNGQESMMQKQNEKDFGGEGKNRDGKEHFWGSEGDGRRRYGKTGIEGRDMSSGIITATKCIDGLNDHNWDDGNDIDDVEAAVRELVNASVGMMSNESRGFMPGYFLSEAEKINKPPVLSWQALLKKYIGTISANKRKTRTRLNRRQPERFDLSGTVDDKVLKIIVAIDTSASVDDIMIAHIINEILGILAKRKHDITVIECDAEVQRIYKAKTQADIQKKVTGRGGTCFSPVIDYINNDKYFRDALLIYFTDGYGESVIPRPRTYRNLWVVIGDARHLSVEEPYGAVVTL